jgi:hypothetical protein
VVCCGADAAEQKRCTACARTQCRGVVEACVLLPAPAGSCLLQLPRLLAPSCALKLDPSPSRGMSSCIAAIPPSGQLPLRRRFFCKFPFLSIRGAAIPPSGQLPLRGRFFFQIPFFVYPRGCVSLFRWRGGGGGQGDREPQELPHAFERVSQSRPYFEAQHVMATSLKLAHMQSYAPLNMGVALTLHVRAARQGPVAGADQAPGPHSHSSACLDDRVREAAKWLQAALDGAFALPLHYRCICKTAPGAPQLHCGPGRRGAGTSERAPLVACATGT